MRERAKEIAESAKRWTGEALQEWGESVKEYPIPHVFSLILGSVLAVVARWIV